MKRSPPMYSLSNLQCHSDDEKKLDSKQFENIESYHNAFGVAIPRLIQSRKVLSLQSGLSPCPIYINNDYKAKFTTIEIAKSKLIMYDSVTNTDKLLQSNEVIDEVISIDEISPIFDISYFSPNSKRNKLRTSFDDAPDGTYKRIFNEYQGINVDCGKNDSKNDYNNIFFNGKLQVVIVDDALVDRKFLTKIVKTQNKLVDVYTVSNGVEVKNFFDNYLNCSCKENIVIFMDINMPYKNGFEATKEIRNIQKDMEPIIIGMSSVDTPEFKNKCIASGMNSFVSKPFTVKKLENLLQEITFNKEYKASYINYDTKTVLSEEILV